MIPRTPFDLIFDQYGRESLPFREAAIFKGRGVCVYHQRVKQLREAREEFCRVSARARSPQGVRGAVFAKPLSCVGLQIPSLSSRYRETTRQGIDKAGFSETSLLENPKKVPPVFPPVFNHILPSNGRYGALHGADHHRLMLKRQQTKNRQKLLSEVAG